VCVKANFTEGKGQLQDCLGALVETVTDDALLKSINLNTLMHTRSEDARVRIFALSCSDSIWRSNGGKLIGTCCCLRWYEEIKYCSANIVFLPGFVAETATFIAECGEDENDTVVKESIKLKDAVESIAGTIEGL
jgi:U3 small nucleolar RNA-associated protein 10